MLSLVGALTPQSKEGTEPLRGEPSADEGGTSQHLISALCREESQPGTSRGKQSYDNCRNSLDTNDEQRSQPTSDVNNVGHNNTGVHIHFTNVNSMVRVTTHDGTNIVAMPDSTM